MLSKVNTNIFKHYGRNFSYVGFKGKQIRLAISGYGQLGSHFHQIIDNSVNLSRMYSVDAIFDTYKFPDRSWNKEILANKNIDAVYIAGPDFTHDVQAIECLKAGKHVLLEKPVYNFDSVLQSAVESDRILSMNLHRRYDPQFNSWRDFMIQQKKPIHKIVFDTYDPNVPENDTNNIEELKFVVGQAQIHDMDLLSWVLPEASVHWTSIEAGESSTIVLKGYLTYSNCEGKTELEMFFKRGHYEALINRVKVNVEKDTETKVWGYEWPIPEGYVYKVWDYAYFHSLYAFYKQVNNIGEYDLTNPVVSRREEGLPNLVDLQSHAKSFKLMAQTQASCDLLFTPKK